MTLKKWLTVWYDTYKAPYLSVNSLRNIESTIRLHIPDSLKSKKLIDVTSFDVEVVLSRIGGCRTAVYVRQILFDAFSQARKCGFVSSNCIECVAKVRYKKTRSRSLTLQEQDSFVSLLQGSKYQSLYLFYLYTGCRCSEALTLRRGDIDFVSKTILIRGTKNYSSYRTIPLSSQLESLLSDFVDSPMITPIFPYSREFVSRLFKRFCPGHHLHDLRHTFITRCAEQGINISVCQQIVGHSTSSLTLDIYTHVVDEFKRREFDKLQF